LAEAEKLASELASILYKINKMLFFQAIPIHFTIITGNIQLGACLAQNNTA